MIAFLSSTCYDLTDLRAEVEKFLRDKGNTLLLSDRANFPIAPELHRHDICIDNVAKCDLFILVIDKRFGAAYYRDESISITWKELREAILCKKQIIAFVRQDIFNERQSCRYNQKLGNPFTPFFADNIKTSDLIDEVQKCGDGIWMQPFDNSVQIKEKLENLYQTRQSPLNKVDDQIEISVDKVSLSTLSDATASFLTKSYNLNNEDISQETIESAIAKIPEKAGVWGELLGFESATNNSNDLFYLYPIRHSGDEGEMIMGISPTALGRSVRSELENVLRKIKDENRAIMLFTDTVKRKPVLCKSCSFRNELYIIGVYEKAGEYIGKIQSLCMLRLFANKWQIIYNEALDEFECYPELVEQCEFIVHDNKLYFYFERRIHHMGSMNQGMGEVEFTLFDFSNKASYKLVYSGKYRAEKIEGDFDFSSLDQSSDSNVYKYLLEGKAKHSKWIYRTPEDYNLDDPKNSIEKWEIENPDFYNNENGKINIHYYNENILYDAKSYGDIEVYKANTTHVETNDYLICYYFGGPILAQRKLDEKYFVVLVPQGFGAGGTWGLRSINEVGFLSPDKIFAKNGYEYYEIDLKESEYIRKQIE